MAIYQLSFNLKDGDIYCFAGRLFTLRGKIYYYHGVDGFTGELTSIYELNNHGQLIDTGHKPFGFDVIGDFDIIGDVTDLGPTEQTIYTCHLHEH